MDGLPREYLRVGRSKWIEWTQCDLQLGAAVLGMNLPDVEAIRRQRLEQQYYELIDIAECVRRVGRSAMSGQSVRLASQGELDLESGPYLETGIGRLLHLPLEN